jgi:hypothetical protein
LSKNLSPSLLDAPQIVKRAFDEANDAIRVEVGIGTSFGLNLSADSGDSITSIPQVLENKVSVTSANTGTIVPAATAIGLKSFNLFTKTTSPLVGAQVCTLQVSPSDSDDVWIDTTLTITPSGTNNTVVMGTVASNIIARRIRVNIAAAITSGTFDIYLVGQAV